MHILFVCGFLGVGVFLGGKSYKALLHQVYLERVKARDQGIDPQIVLIAVDQMWIGDILRDHIAWLPLDFLLAADDFDTAAATRR